ncbi:MAG TPA: glycogen debranching N-terminal domain-containing protein, partial [Actinomycetota bacterium]|nr:glycogen debranching N-terminal domain-containing protein [Actinomycetota bacterium]
TSEAGKHQKADVTGDTVTFNYAGSDGVARSTEIRFSPAPEKLTEHEAMFEFTLDHGEEAQLTLEITPIVEGERQARQEYRQARQDLEQSYASWRKRCTRFKTGNTQLTGFLERAVIDLRMLLAEDDDGGFRIDAGVPWYSALFGRDAIITAYECLGVNPNIAWGALRALASQQGKEDDDWREEEPGKILHEMRVGELAGCGEIPHTPYFGSVDTTPLWLVLLTYAYAWTADLDAVRELWPNALSALGWIDKYGDRDGDGFVEYERRSSRGLDNQGWKDSWNALIHPDGTLAEGPIALVEVQGYVYQAKARMAPLARAVGDDELAGRLEREAAELKRKFNEAFWMEDEGYYALALDRNKQQVPTITSNPGHGFWSGIIDDEKAPRVARKLVSPALSSGWGVRTLASRQQVYDPLGYHNGAIWPHDNALIAHGLKLYGFDVEAMKIVDQLSAAGASFPLGRYPELFCGFSRDDVPVPVEYPVACRPQAWATGAPLLMIRSYGGFTADAPAGRLYVVRPQLPAWLDRVEILGMRVGSARVDLSFSARDGVTATQVPRKEGDVEVLIRQ